jgi:hypothetical protein
MGGIRTFVLVLVCAGVLAPLNLFAQTGRSKKGARVGPRGAAVKSPMPPGRPEWSPEELGLIRPKPVAYDLALAEACRRYAQGDERTRAAERRALDDEDLGILIGFAERAAVFGIRERGTAWLKDGLAAIAMLELGRVDDDRVVVISLGLLYHAARRVGASPEELFRDAAALAEPKTRRFISAYPARPESIKELHNATGYEEIETDAGVGFIGWDFGKYEPTYDLKKVAVDVTLLIAADPKYAFVNTTVATNLWRGGRGTADTAYDRALQRARGGADVYAQAIIGGRAMDTLTVQIVETEDEPSARALLGAMKREREVLYSTLALAEGRLFFLLSAGSGSYDVKSMETPESIRRFSAGLAEILRRHTKR